MNKGEQCRDWICQNKKNKEAKKKMSIKNQKPEMEDYVTLFMHSPAKVEQKCNIFVHKDMKTSWRYTSLHPEDGVDIKIVCKKNERTTPQQSMWKYSMLSKNIFYIIISQNKIYVCLL